MGKGYIPKPTSLKLIDGTHTTYRNGDAEASRAAVKKAAEHFGKLEKPEHLRGHASDIWDKTIAPAWWLDGSRLTTAIMMCELWAEYRNNPKRFPIAKYTQMRTFLRELGLSDERNRVTNADQEEDDNFA
jgi:phage terminase small subunit